VARQYTLYSEIAALEKAIFFKCLQPVLRTGRSITALTSQHRRNNPLIDLYQDNKRISQPAQELFHELEVLREQKAESKKQKAIEADDQ
jgi:hypothetical protein